MKLFSNNINYSKSALTAGNLFKLFIIEKKFVLLFVSFFTLLIIFYAFIKPITYYSSVTLFPPEQNSSSGGLSSFLQSVSGGISFDNIGKDSKLMAYVDYVKSREVCGYINDSLNIQSFFKLPTRDDAIDVLIDMLDVNISKSNIISIGVTINTKYFGYFSDRTPYQALCQKIALKAVDGLDKMLRNKSISKAKKKRIFIEKVLIDKKKNLDTLDNTIISFQKQHKVILIEEQTKAILDNAVKVGTDLQKAELDLAMKHQEYDANSPIIKSQEQFVSKLKQQYSQSQSGGMSNDEFSIPLTNVASLQKTYLNLMRDKKILEQLILYLETQKYQEAIQEESDYPVIEILDAPVFPHKSIAPNKTSTVLLGFLIFSITGLAIVVIRAFVKGYIYINNEDKLS